MIRRTARVAQVEGLFDVPPSQRSGETWHVDLPVEERDWNVGLIVGPSGCGKSTIARELFGLPQEFEWPGDASVVDAFPQPMGIKEITELLSSVGFSAPPLWLRPFAVLSTGQQMRVTVARLLAEQPDLAVMDEFTSVVDRTVAQIGSNAIAKAVRRRGQRFVAVTCHYDVLDWLQPDWVFEPHTNQFSWRGVQRRPPITLSIARVHPQAWELFRQYHYMSHDYHRGARTFVAFYGGEPVALCGVLPFPHGTVKNLRRIHRAVCLPDYQGVGIGNALIEYIASAYRAVGNRITNVTASPSLNASYSRNPRWKLLRAPSFNHTGSAKSKLAPKMSHASKRYTSSWEYIGPAMELSDALALTGKL